MFESESSFEKPIVTKPPTPDFIGHEAMFSPEAIGAALRNPEQRALILGQSKEIGTSRGEMYDLRNDLARTSIEVKTGNGAVVSPERMIFTERMWGCTTLFITDSDRKSLIHLTPRHSSLSYKEMKEGEKIHDMPVTITRILTAIEPDQTKRAGLTVTIIGNIGKEDNGDYSYQTLYDDWHKLKQALYEQGVKAVRIVEAPLDETGVYHLPQTPNTLYLVGNKTDIKPDGNLMIQKDVEAITVDLREQPDSLIQHPQSFYAQEVTRYRTMDIDERAQEREKLEAEYMELYKKILTDKSGTIEEHNRFELIALLLRTLNTI